MISIECVVAYKNLAYREDSQLTAVERNARIEKNNKRLRYVYTGAAITGLILFVAFGTFTLILLIGNCTAE